MKNIILLGVPRAGKSTFAKMILKKYPNYNIIQHDIIASAYTDTVRHINRNSMIPYDMDFVNLLLNKIFFYSAKYEPKLNFILDSNGMEIDNINRFRYNNIIIVFGYPNITPQQCLENFSKYDTIDDWTFSEPEWRLKILADTYVDDSKKYEQKCKELKVKFVDTSDNRNEVLKDLLIWLEKEIGK